VLGIKEPPLDDIPSHTNEQIHFMFSHTAKGQRYNTSLLERFIKDPQADSNKKYRRLIDYELLTDGDGKRTIGFGYHAGGLRFLPLIFFDPDGFCYSHL
jgi:alpha-aminoadipic semialdehyde synthase